MDDPRTEYVPLARFAPRQSDADVDSSVDWSTLNSKPCCCWWIWFGQGFAIESSNTNHKYSRKDRQRLHDYESVDYLAANSRVYREWLGRQPHQRWWDYWLLLFLVALLTGAVGYCLHGLVEFLTDFRVGIAIKLAQNVHIAVAWLFNVTIGCVFVLFASIFVVKLALEAKGSGIPEVMAYLNGVHLPRVFNIWTLLVKFCSCVLSVASGLPLGPEGPMVHIGAILGASLSQMHSTTIGFDLGMFKRFRNPKDKRDFVTVGSAVGITAAFGAPIGGLLFGLEELASHWNWELLLRIFFATAMTMQSTDFLRSLGQGSLGEFQPSLFLVPEVIKNHAFSVLPALLMGVISGIMAIAFTMLCIKFNHMKQSLLQKNWQKIVDPLVTVFVYLSIIMVIPLMFGCTSTKNATNGPQNFEDLVSNHSLVAYDCQSMSGNDTDGYYNQFATLMLSSGEQTIQNLYSRGTHRLFGYGPLITILIIYFVAASWVQCSYISGGLFVPMLVMGALMGRVVGLLAVDICARLGYGSEGAPAGVFSINDPNAWVDPGVFALIGSGTFMGGATRLTISIAVIMMEVSDDTLMVLPMLFGVLVAKWVADICTHSLYHAILESNCIPYLPSLPPSKYNLDLVEVKHALTSYNIVNLYPKMKVRDIQRMLQSNRHNGFPVVQETSIGEVLVGFMIRDHLLVLIERVYQLGRTTDLDVAYYDLSRKHFDPMTRVRQSDQQLEEMNGHNHHVNGCAQESDQEMALRDERIDLTPYIIDSTFSVKESQSLYRAYILFRSMGLRHLPVVDNLGRVKGILTRKDMLGFKLEAAASRKMGSVQQT